MERPVRTYLWRAFGRFVVAAGTHCLRDALLRNMDIVNSLRKYGDVSPFLQAWAAAAQHCCISRRPAWAARGQRAPCVLEKTAAPRAPAAAPARSAAHQEGGIPSLSGGAPVRLRHVNNCVRRGVKTGTGAAQIRRPSGDTLAEGGKEEREAGCVDGDIARQRAASARAWRRRGVTAVRRKGCDQLRNNWVRTAISRGL
jgi:hypothetical protein